MALAVRLDGKHVVFGQVVEGMNVVQALERQGSQSGKTSSQVLFEHSSSIVG